jgi:hypothetical protein
MNLYQYIQIGGLGLILLLFKGYGCGSYCKLGYTVGGISV